MTSMRKLIFITSFLLLGLVSPAVSQTQDGSVTGSVRDEQGGTVPGSDVEIQGPDAAFRFITDADGAFRFLNLQPGRYHVSASLSGFRTAARDVIVATGHDVD